MSMTDSGAISRLNPFAGSWIDEKISQRQESVRMRLLREMHGRHKAKRAQRRLYAQAALVTSLILLSVTMVEMGRRAHRLWVDSEQRQEISYAVRH